MTIDQLRESLFETLQAVKSGAMDANQAKTISDVAQTIINTAKVEIDYMKASGGNISSRFIEAPASHGEFKIPTDSSVAAQLAGVTRHICK